jgi:glycosyltransferase involved in cell wall biosynthesis
MHIGLFSTAWPINEHPHGIVTYVHYLRSELINQGHRVSVFAKTIGRTNIDPGIYLVKPTAAYRFRRKLAGLTGQGSYDTLYWGEAIAATVNRVSRKDSIEILEMEESFGWCADVQKRVSCPVVVKLHGPAFLTLVEEDRRTAFAAAKIEMEGQGLRQITSIIAPSECALLSTITRYQLNPKIKKVIRNPIKIDPKLERWELDHCDRKTILFVGRFDKLKGGDTVLIAFRRLLEIDDSLKLIFVGANHGLTSTDGPRIFFEEFKRSLFTEKQIRSIDYLGELPRADIFNLRTKAMLTVVASRWENQPNTALEAMIQGCPIVATNAGGISEIIDNDVTGLLAHRDDIEDFCQKIMRIINNPDMARRMGENARRYVTDCHSARELTKETVEVYDQAIAMAQAGKR